MPAGLKHVELHLLGSLVLENLDCLLEALARCPRLRALDLCISGKRVDGGGSSSEDEAWAWSDGDDRLKLFPDARALAKLPTLTRLALRYKGHKVYASIFAGVASSLVSLTGLVELSVGFVTSYYVSASALGRVGVPAALGQLKGLESLEITRFDRCNLEPGCFDLPKLRSLAFRDCNLEGEDVLPGVSALQSLTRIEFSGGKGPSFFDPQLVQLPLLQHMVFETIDAYRWDQPAVLPSRRLTWAL